MLLKRILDQNLQTKSKCRPLQTKFHVTKHFKMMMCLNCCFQTHAYSKEWYFQIFSTASFSKVTPIKFALQGYHFSGLINKSPFYSQTKHDMKNLRYSCQEKPSKLAHIQRSGILWNNAKNCPTVHPNFTVESKTSYTARNICRWYTRMIGLNICHLYMFPMHVHKKGKFFFVFQCFYFIK